MIRKTIARRPAETGGGLGAAVTLTAAALGASTNVVAALGAWAALLPAAITGWRQVGGASGVVRFVLRGR